MTESQCNAVNDTRDPRKAFIFSLSFTRIPSSQHDKQDIEGTRCK